MIGPLIGAAASIAGGLLANKAQKKQNQANEAAALRQEQLQKEFAQSGIQWKVRDAEQAGIHPLYALGANTTSYQPTNVGGGAADFSFVSEAGQNIGRAIDATRSTPASALAIRLGETQLEGARLDNDLKRTQLASSIATLKQTSTPGIPSLFQRGAMDGQGDSPQVAGIVEHDPKKPQYTTNLKWGKHYEPSPYISDASSFEDRYGEMSDYIMGPAAAYMDYWHNVAPIVKENIYDKLRR